MKIKILGVENASRKELENKVKTAMKKLSVQADIQIIAAVDEILKHDITGIPALMVNDKIVAQKMIPDEAKVTSFLLS